MARFRVAIKGHEILVETLDDLEALLARFPVARDATDHEAYLAGARVIQDHQALIEGLAGPDRARDISGAGGR